MLRRIAASGLLVAVVATMLAAPPARAFTGCPSAMQDAEYAKVLGSFAFEGNERVEGLKFTVDCIYPGGSLILSQVAQRQGQAWRPIEHMQGYYDRASKAIYLPTLGVMVRHVDGTWRAHLPPDAFYRTVTFEHGD